MFRYFAQILLFITTIVNVGAQDVSFVASAPETVQVGEQFRVTYEINDRVTNFQQPSFSDFMFLSSQQGISTINWKTTQQFVFILKASKKGTFVISPATAKHKGKKIESNKLTIKVVENKQTGSSGKTGSPGVSTQPSSKEEVFARLMVDKRNVYVGEQITAYIKVYTKSALSGIDNSFKGPDFTGFYVQNVKIPPLRSLEPEKVGNETYYSGVIRKMILIPQRSGKMAIAPFEIVVQQDKKVRIGHFTTYQAQNVPLTTKKVTINVKSLPSNKPAGFTGAIGDLNISATMSPDEVKTNDAVMLKVKVSGTGNIKLIDNINYNLPPTFDVFDPVVKTNISENGRSGSKVFEITAIPRHAGEFTVKPFELVYFNPRVGNYITKKTKSFTLKVNKATGDSATVIISNMSREDVELLESDIRYIKTETKFKGANAYYIDSIWYYLVLIVSFLLFITIIVLKREQIKRNADLARTKHKKAGKTANKRFKLVRKLIKENKDEEFYEELSKALWGYVSDKLSMPLSELSADQAKEKLIQKELEPKMVEELLDIISTCEYARYAPGTIEKKPAELLNEANKLLTKIDQNI